MHTLMRQLRIHIHTYIRTNVRTYYHNHFIPTLQVKLPTSRLVELQCNGSICSNTEVVVNNMQRSLQVGVDGEEGRKEWGG